MSRTSEIRENRVGETARAGNGEMMTIIAYRAYSDIDIRFNESGYIAKHKCYQNFKSGKIKGPKVAKPARNANKGKRERRIGEKNIANNGMEMTITEYRNSNDIDVRFADGMETRHVSYSSFLAGSVGNLNISSKAKRNRVGEKSVSNGGEIIEIVKYVDAHDIDVKFPDGSISQHKAYSSFKKGTIENPKTKKHVNADTVIGLTKASAYGETMTITGFRSKDDIDVTFSDGTVVRHACISAFRQGHIANPNYFPKKRVGEKRMSSCGLLMEIIAYRSAHDIDVRFSNGYVARHKYYSNFRKGMIASDLNQRNPKVRRK